LSKEGDLWFRRASTGSKLGKKEEERGREEAKGLRIKVSSSQKKSERESVRQTCRWACTVKERRKVGMESSDRDKYFNVGSQNSRQETDRQTQSPLTINRLKNAWALFSYSSSAPYGAGQLKGDSPGAAKGRLKKGRTVCGRGIRTAREWEDAREKERPGRARGAPLESDPMTNKVLRLGKIQAREAEKDAFQKNTRRNRGGLTGASTLPRARPGMNWW